MALSDEQAAQLAALEAERDAPPVRTQTGLAGVLHKIVQWAVPGPHQDELHDAVEAAVGDHGQDHDTAADSNPAEPPGPADF